MNVQQQKFCIEVYSREGKVQGGKRENDTGYYGICMKVGIGRDSCKHVM